MGSIPKTKRNLQIERLYNEGFRVAELSRKFKVSKQRIRQILDVARELRVWERKIKKNKKIQGLDKK